MITRTSIGNRFFPTLSPSLATNWSASLTTVVFNKDVPARVTSQANLLHQALVEYKAALLTVGLAAAITAAAGNNVAAVFSIADVNQMYARLVLGHHLKKMISSRVLETFRANRIFLIPANTEPTVLLEVPLAAADVHNVVQRQDVHVRKGWLAAYSAAVSVKQYEKEAKRSAPVAAVTSLHTNSESGNTRRTRVEQAPQRTDATTTVQRGRGTGPSSNAEARPLKTGYKRNLQTHQHHRGGAGGPAAAVRTTGHHGVERRGERFRTAGTAVRHVAAGYVCCNCGTKGDHTVFEC